MCAAVSQLPVKSLRWTINLALSAFLTGTALNYFIQPGELVDAVRRFGASLRRLSFKAAIKAGGLQHTLQPSTLQTHLSNPINKLK